MDGKVFLSTFTLVFLAELGDKTQLTALAAASGSKSTWTVFWAASTALVLSTLLAVITGVLLKNQSMIPMSALKIAAGILFLIFGIITLKDGIWGEEKIISTTAISKGVAYKLATTAAINLEKTHAEHYDLLAKTATNSKLKEAFLNLAKMEREHCKCLTDNEFKFKNSNEIETISILPTISKDQLDGKDGKLITNLIIEEKTMAKFYTELASVSKISSIRSIFLKLAQEETEHVSILQSLIKPNS